MNGTITVNRGERTAIALEITPDDPAYNLLGKRVTLSLCEYPYNGDSATLKAALAKASGLGVSSAQVAINLQLAAQIQAVAYIEAPDFDALTKEKYFLSVWVDDGAGGDRCVTPNGGGAEILEIQPAASRT